MKTVVLLAAALALTPAAASADWFYDPTAEGLVRLPDNPNPANVAAARASAARYSVAVRVWDPGEGEFVTERVVADPSANSLAAAADAARYTIPRRVWAPHEGDFETEYLKAY